MSILLALMLSAAASDAQAASDTEGTPQASAAQAPAASDASAKGQSAAPPEAKDAPEIAQASAPAAPPASPPQGALAEPDPVQQQLISGAPLQNPNVAVHIVERKPFTDKGRHELALYPAMAQVNGKFTQHYGSALSYTYHLHENLGIQITPQYNWSSGESAFNLELVDKVRQQGQPASTLLLTWATTAGVEVTPLYGKFAFYENALAQFSVVLTGGAGLGQTRHLLKPPTISADGARIPETYGDTGQRFVGNIGGGLRVQMWDRFTLRFEVRDLVYTARVDQVNGCNSADLDAMFNVYEAGATSLAGLPVHPGCNLNAFQGLDPATHEDRINDVPRARDLVIDQNSDVLNNVGFYAGFSVLF